MFTVLKGQIAITVRGTTTTLAEGSTINIPANAPHHFRNTSGAPARLLCMCLPAGQDDYFARVGDTLPTRDSAPMPRTETEIAERRHRAAQLGHV